MTMSTKPFRRWCTVSASCESIIWIHHASAHGETKAAYLRRMCRWYGGPLESVGCVLREIEVRVVPPKPKKKARRKP